MGAIRPWHVALLGLVCLLGVGGVVAVVAAVLALSRRRR